MTKVKALVLAARPKTLSASAVPIIATMGMVYGLYQQVHWGIVLFALFSSCCIQIGTNYVNDAMDFKKGADTQHRLGPKRMTQQGIFSFQQVMTMAAVFFILAVAFGIPLVLHGGWVIIGIGLISILFGYAYTSGPYPLAYWGLGDLFVILFFGIVAVGGLYYLLTASWQIKALVLGLQIGLVSTILIAINNLRDIHTDQLVNKKTMAVRLGKNKSRLWLAFLCAGPFIVGHYWLFVNLEWVYIIPLFSAPLAFYIAQKIFRTEPSPAYNKYLALASLLGIIFSLLVAIGFQIK